MDSTGSVNVSLAPIFLCGVGRSGTSYVRRLLNACPRVHLSFEGRMLKEGIHLSRRLRRRAGRGDFYRLLNLLRARESETVRNRALIETVESRREVLYEAWVRSPSYAALMAAIYWHAYHRPLWGDKLLRIEQCFDIGRVWPRGRFLILYRDPRAVFASQKHKWGFTPQLSAGYWTTHVNLSNKLLEERGAAAMAVRYEDLLADSVPTLGQVLRFLGLADPSLADSLLHRCPPDRRALNRWSEVLSRSEIETVETYCGSHMHALGYPLRTSAQWRSLSRWSYAAHLFGQYAAVLRSPTTITRKRLWRKLPWMLSHLANGSRTPLADLG